MPAKILTVANDIDVLMAVRTRFDPESYRCKYASTLDEADRMIVLDRPDAVILDCDLTADSGVSFLHRLRTSTSGRRLPVLLVSELASEAACVSALEAGADDYLRKPVSSSELRARVRATLRPYSAFPPVEEISVSGLTIAPVTKRAFRRTAAGDVSLRLTHGEFQLLHLFLAHPCKVFSREDVLWQAWGKETSLDVATVDVHVCKLRRKLRTVNCADMIDTVPGKGYRLVASTEDR